jgi:hypothetical protein
MTPLLDTDGAKGAEWPATVRGWASGLYLRDQWQITPKMTASVGVRWEYYPFPTHGSRARDVRLQHEPAAGVRHWCGKRGCLRHQSSEGSLYTTARPGVPADRRYGHSRRVLPQPQSDNAVTRVGGIAQAFPQIIQITESGPNTFTPVGSITTGVPLVPALDLSPGVVRLPAGAGVTTLEGDSSGAPSRRGT